MRYTLFALSLAAAITATAQHQDNSYNYSVFSGFYQLNPTDGGKMMLEQEKVGGMFPGWNVNVDKLTNRFKDIYGDAIEIPGSTLDEKVVYCMENKLKTLGIKKEEWKQTRNTKAPHASYVSFAQYIDGHQVVFSNLDFRFTKDSKLVRVKMAAYGYPAIKSPNLLDRNRIINTGAYIADIKDATINSQTLSEDWKWFPVPSQAGYTLRPVYEFKVNGASANFPMELVGYVDAETGEMLYRSNEVHEALKIKVVSDSIYKVNRTIPVSTEPLQHLRLTIGSNNHYTNDTGVFEDASINLPETVSFDLSGTWARVRTNGGNTPNFTATFNSNDSTYIFAADGSSSIRHVNAYYHTNVAHDFMKTKLPNFTGLDVVATVNVEVPGTCNAYYSNGNTSLNFFPPGGGCVSFAEIGDVIYHEYGHGISYKFYSSQGANFSNAALGEGNSDVWAMSITRDSILGRYSRINNPGSYIRRYDMAPKVFPINVNGEEHNDGEIIAGSWYFVAKYTGSFDVMTDLFVKTLYDVPNGPNGTEGDVYHDILISAILNDDNDGILSNGTPHLQEIVRAFAKHGIYIMSGATLTHTELAHQEPNTPIPVTASLSISESSFFQDIKLFYKVRGSNTWDSTTMTNNGNLQFTGQLPGFPTLSVIDYYFKVYDVLGNATYGFPNGYNTTYSINQVTIPYQFAVGLRSSVKEDFEGNADGWTIGNVTGDNATSGEWVLDKPIGSYYGGLITQTDKDHTTGIGKCLVTGNSGGQYNTSDVDNGVTSVLSPVYDMNNFMYPVVEYYRWFSNDRGQNGRNDPWQVFIRDTTSPLWVTVEFSYQADYNWRRRIFQVREYLPFSRFVQLKFVAKDAVQMSIQDNGQNCVEAALDDFAIYDLALSALNTSSVAADNAIKVYPNPATDFVNIILPSAQTGSISLIDISGRKIAEQVVNSSENKYVINTAGLAAGSYMLSVKTDKTSEVKKITIAR